MRRILDILRKQPKPLRFLAAQALWRSGFCKLCKIRMRGYQLRFFPTNLSNTLWIDRHNRDEDLEFIARALQSGETYVDVGANIGFTAIEGSRAVGPAGKVFAFEPHPTIFSYFQQNLQLNGCSNTKAFNVALDREPGELRFMNDRRDDMNRISAGGGLVVRAETLDKMIPFSAAERIQLLKVDVEGAERSVFAGASEVLRRTDTLYFEAYQPSASAFGYRIEQLLDDVRANGFQLFELDAAYRLCTLSNNFGENIVNVVAARDAVDLARRLRTPSAQHAK